MTKENKDLMSIIFCSAHDKTREYLSENELSDVEGLDSSDFSYHNVFRGMLAIEHVAVRESA